MRFAWIATVRARRALLGCALATLVAPGGAFAQEATGGALAPAAAFDVSHAGGEHAPLGQNTGGSEYGFAAAAPHRASSPRRPSAVKRALKRPSKRALRPASKPAPKPRRRPAPAPKPPPKPAPAPKPSPPPVPTPSSPPAEGLPAGVPTPAQTLSDGAVFPVQGGPHSYGSPEDRFGAPRGNHTHQGQDVLAAEGLSDVAPLAGTIIATGNQPAAAGWYVAEHTSIGFDLFFAHCQTKSVQVNEGDSVSPGTVLCKLGSTGDATGPHLHFEMWIGGWHAKGGRPIDPLPYLEAWEGR